MSPIASVREEMKNALGSARLNTTVSVPSAVTEEISATSGAHTQAVAGSFSRSNCVTTASASKGVPSLNVTSSRKVMVQVRRSSEPDHSVAREGARFPSSSRSTSGS